MDDRGTAGPRKDTRNRRGRRYDVARLRRSGLPRALLSHAGPVGIEARRYMRALIERLGLPVPPPAWAEPYLVDGTRAHVVLGQLHRALDVEMAQPEPSRAEARRLRSEVRRTTSQRARAESVLGKMVEEHRKTTGPVSLHALARAARG